MNNIQMTQLGVNNILWYTTEGKKKLCQITQVYNDTKTVEVKCVGMNGDEEFIESVNLSSLDGIEVNDDIIKILGFTMVANTDYPYHGHPENFVYDLTYEKIDMMIVRVGDSYKFLINNGRVYSTSIIKLCVHHLQNLLCSYNYKDVTMLSDIKGCLKDIN